MTDVGLRAPIAKAIATIVEHFELDEELHANELSLLETLFNDVWNVAEGIGRSDVASEMGHVITSEAKLACEVQRLRARIEELEA